MNLGCIPFHLGANADVTWYLQEDGTADFSAFTEAHEHGTAIRNILRGKTWDILVPDEDHIRGGSGELRTRYWLSAIAGPGLTAARGRLIAGGQDAGSACRTHFVAGSDIGGFAAQRGVSWRTYENTSPADLDITVNAVLDGSFFHKGGSVIAALHVLDAQMVRDQLSNAGTGAAEFLLERDDYGRIANSDGINISLATLFPAEALIAEKIERFSESAGALAGDEKFVTETLATDSATIGAGEQFVVLFDVATHCPEGGGVDFWRTLSPAPDFFTDESGAPLTEIVALGPSDEEPQSAVGLDLSPADGEGPVGTMQEATALATAGGGAPVPDLLVEFSVVSGPNQWVAGLAVTDENGEAVFSYHDLEGIGGTDTIEASIGSLLSNQVTRSWTVPGLLDHIVISPQDATIPPGGDQAYAAEAFDRFGNSLGDVTAQTIFTIEDGSCVGNSCTATTPGPHTVTGTYMEQSDTATLTVDESLIFGDGFEVPDEGP
jgi:hypothetical protein